MHEDGLTRSIQHDVSTELAKVPMGDTGQVAMGESARVRHDGFPIKEPEQRARPESECPVEPARGIAQHGEGQISEPTESSQRRRILEADHEEGGIELVQEALLFTQLRDVLPARDSPEPAQEHEQHWLALIGLQRGGVPLEIQQVNVEYIVHRSASSGGRRSSRGQALATCHTGTSSMPD